MSGKEAQPDGKAEEIPKELGLAVVRQQRLLDILKQYRSLEWQLKSL